MSVPFFHTWTAQKDARPISLLGGQGSWFETSEGRWLDLGSLVFQANLGHGHPKMIEAIKAQADRLCMSHPAADFPEKRQLSHKLLAHAPAGFSKIFFSLGGSDAVENAMKIARMSTGRTGFVSRERSYHGASFGALSLTGDWRRPPLEPTLPRVVRVADFDRLNQGATKSASLSLIPNVLNTDSDIAAVFVEPVVGANGVLIPPPGYMREIREACDQHGVLLVVDEVLTGFGRTGKWFAYEHFDDVVPDMITVGKALTAGYGTLGAVLVHERVASSFEEKVLYCGLTHYGHPLGVAAGLAALSEYEAGAYFENANILSTVLRSGLDEIVRDCESATRVRAIGMLAAVDLDLTDDEWRVLRKILGDRRLHVHIRPRVGTVILSPPLCMTRDELESGLSMLKDSIAEVVAA